MSDAELITDAMLSAYLDGELSEAERVRVVERLEHDEKARRILEELRGIREEIRRLPRQSLSAGFASRITDRISVPSEAKSRPGISGRPANRSRTRLAAILAAVAALFLISIWGINYLPSPSVANRPTDLNRGAETPDQARDDEVKKLDDSATPSSEALKLKQPSEIPQASVPFMEQVTNRNLPRDAAPPSDKSAFGLIVDYQVDANQLREISTAWSQYKTPPQENQNPPVSEFVIAGTPSEITSLLAGVRARSSDIRGPSMDEFKHLGLRFLAEREVSDQMAFPSPTESVAESRHIKELTKSEIERLPERIRRQAFNMLPADTAANPPTDTRRSSVTEAQKGLRQVGESLVESPDADAPVIRVLVRFVEQVD